MLKKLWITLLKYGMKGHMNNKLKPVNCGCGGEAKVDTKLVSCTPVERKRVYCSKCYISTEWMKSEAEAIEAWNRAMSAGKDEIAITKGYWMAIYDGLHCSVCNYKCETTALPEVCPHCGTRLIRW